MSGPTDNATQARARATQRGQLLVSVHNPSSPHVGLSRYADPRSIPVPICRYADMPTREAAAKQQQLLEPLESSHEARSRVTGSTGKQPLAFNGPAPRAAASSTPRTGGPGPVRSPRDCGRLSVSVHAPHRSSEYRDAGTAARALRPGLCLHQRRVWERRCLYASPRPYAGRLCPYSGPTPVGYALGAAGYVAARPRAASLAPRLHP